MSRRMLHALLELLSASAAARGEQWPAAELRSLSAELIGDHLVKVHLVAE